MKLIEGGLVLCSIISSYVACDSLCRWESSCVYRVLTVARVTAPTTLRIRVLWDRLPIGSPRFRSIGLTVRVLEECRMVPQLTPLVYRLGKMNMPMRLVILPFPVPAVVMAGD